MELRLKVETLGDTAGHVIESAFAGYTISLLGLGYISGARWP
jgi:hypothetical protein